jgi:hypothetical protein
MNDEEAAEHIKYFDNNGNGKIEFSGTLAYLCIPLCTFFIDQSTEFLKVLGEK